MKRKLPTILWGEFVDGKLFLGQALDVMYGFGGYLYPSKKAASRHGNEARRVEVREVKRIRVKGGK